MLAHSVSYGKGNPNTPSPSPARGDRILVIPARVHVSYVAPDGRDPLRRFRSGVIEPISGRIVTEIDEALLAIAIMPSIPVTNLDRISRKRFHMKYPLQTYVPFRITAK